MEDDGIAGSVAAYFQPPDNGTGRAVGGDDGNDGGIGEDMSGVGGGSGSDGGIGDGVLAQGVADDGDVEVAVPVGGLTEDAATDGGEIETLRKEFLNVVVGRAVELAEIGLVEEIEAAGFAGGHSEIGMSGRADRSGENEDAAGTEIDIVGAERVLVIGSEEVELGTGSAEFDDGIAEVDGAIEVAVGGFDPDVAT